MDDMAKGNARWKPFDVDAPRIVSPDEMIAELHLLAVRGHGNGEGGDDAAQPGLLSDGRAAQLRLAAWGRRSEGPEPAALPFA
jgi:hypothetical protein